MKLNFLEASIGKLYIHKVGNKILEEKLTLSESAINVDDNLKEILTHYFLSSFNEYEHFNFHHSVELSLNVVFNSVKKIFQNPDTILNESKNISKHLYDNSTHPKINGGEFYVVYFKDCLFNDKKTDAIGLFKSERKDTFIEVEQSQREFDIRCKKGINIDKLDKGCIIFNLQQESGFVLSIVDNVNKGREALYWKDDFLNVQTLNNSFHQTNEFLGITKDFIINQLSNEVELNKADKIDFLNRSVNYFKENTSFDKTDFEEKVFEDSDIIDSFRNFENNFKGENEVVFEDNFEISTEAVKKQARKFKSVLKLDKNFHIYIHGDRNLIEQGIDDKGRKFYKIYYDEEN